MDVMADGKTPVPFACCPRRFWGVDFPPTQRQANQSVPHCRFLEMKPGQWTHNPVTPKQSKNQIVENILKKQQYKIAK